jgi:ferric-dicitrate binding protein FerR (iron transport regulator)
MAVKGCPPAELLGAFVDGRLHGAEREAFESHLAGCDGCRGEVVDLGRLKADVAASSRIPSASWMQAARRARAPRRLWIPAAAAAAAIVALALAFVMRPDPPPPLVRTIPVPPPRPEASKPPPEPEPAPEPPRPPAPLPSAPAPKPEPPPPPPAVPDTPPKAAPPEPPKPVVEPPRSAPPEKRVTVTVVAKLVEAQGEVWDAAKGAVKPGTGLLAGQGLVTGRGRAAVEFPDGTRIELGARTTVKEIRESEDSGKRVAVGAGIVTAKVARQAPGRAAVFSTPQGEARVLGTALRLAVDEKAVRVDVLEGRVRFARADGKSVDLTAGTFVTAAPGQDLAKANATGLVAHWKLDDGGADASGNLVHGELKGAAETSPGRLGGGVKFGPAGHLSVPDFQLPEQFTAAFWVWQTALTREQDWLLNFGNNQFILIREGNMDARQIRVGWHEAPQDFVTVGSAIQPRQWAHFAATYDGAELRLFVNGQSVGSKKGGRRAAGPGLAVGRMGAGGEGLIDDVRVYDRALSAPEIQSVLRGGSALPVRR